MKALYEKISLEESASFLIKKFAVRYFDAPLHFHPEYELTYIINGYGKRFVGDSVEEFSSGDLVLLGSNIPHFWCCDKDFYEDDKLKAEAIVIQFSVDFVEKIIGNIPEFKGVYGLLKKSNLGLKFANNESITNTLYQISESRNIIQFLDFLTVLSQVEHGILASQTSKPDTNENERMRRILDFTLNHFTEEISVEKVAEIAHLSVPSFCRYFKQRTRKTYIDYLNELRIAHARRLLMTTDFSISQVGLECGFQNLSNFHRVFKKLVGETPLRFRATWA
ncbi:MAG: AraC family transcriptional regulator [Spirosomaceae bacterium]|nr:AraC family transcriptional regulator [Spirosomataceae bacterium]